MAAARSDRALADLLAATYVRRVIVERFNYAKNIELPPGRKYLTSQRALFVFEWYFQKITYTFKYACFAWRSVICWLFEEYSGNRLICFIFDASRR